MDLQRVGVKVFCAEGGDIDLLEFIPIFHRWIQQHTTDRLLIDVADYSHVEHGPGILLAAHEGNYSIDEARGRRGLLYHRKAVGASGSGDLDTTAALVDAARQVLSAAKLLEAEPELAGRLRFAGDEVEVFSNDRLAGPNTDEGFARFQPAATSLFERLFDGGSYDAVREADQRERLALSAKAAAATGVAQLLERLDG